MVNDPEKKIHFHIVNKQPGISMKAADDSTELQFRLSLQSN
jgi:hypothetical protein